MDTHNIMKAVQLLGDIKSPKLALNHAVEKPSPTGSNILVKVDAAGVNGDAVTWPEMYARESHIPGIELSGTISALGPDYRGPFVINQAVYAMVAADHGQAQADYVICTPDELAPKPSTISHAEAAVIPVPLLTAWEGLSDYGPVTSGMRVLITGASGAVGSIAVQLVARITGTHTIALASAKHHESLKLLGATEAIDYEAAGWEETIHGVDVVFDTVGGEVLAKAWKTVQDKGIVITVGDPPPSWAFGKDEPQEIRGKPEVRYKYFIVSPSAKRLSEANALIDSGELKPIEVQTFPFDEALEAWDFARRRGRGKKVVIMF